VSRRILKIRRVDQPAAPLFTVAVGGHGFFAAPELFARLAALLFLPLIHLHLPAQADAIGRDAEFFIRQNFLRGGLGRKVHEFALVRGVHLLGAHVEDQSLTLLERLVCFNRAALVPEKENDGDNEQDEPDKDSSEGFADTAEPRRTGSDLDGIGHGS